MRAFNYGRTIHAQALTEKGRENFDKIFKKEKQKKADKNKQHDARGE